MQKIVLLHSVETYRCISIVIIDVSSFNQLYGKYNFLPQVLGMAPTRELSKQVADDFKSISSTMQVLSIFGGVPYGPQGMIFDRFAVLLILGLHGCSLRNPMKKMCHLIQCNIYLFSTI